VGFELFQQMPDRKVGVSHNDSAVRSGSVGFSARDGPSSRTSKVFLSKGVIGLPQMPLHPFTPLPLQPASPLMNSDDSSDQRDFTESPVREVRPRPAVA